MSHSLKSESGASSGVSSVGSESGSTESSGSSVTCHPELEFGYVRNALPSDYAVPFIGNPIEVSGSPTRAGQPMLCTIDQEVFCGSAQPLAATYNRNDSLVSASYSITPGQAPLDLAISLASEVGGYDLSTNVSGNDCDATAGTVSANLNSGNLVLSYSLPSGGPADPPLRLFYNSMANDEVFLGPYGQGWSDLYDQWLDDTVGSGSGTRTYLSELVNPAGLKWMIHREEESGRIESIVGPHGKKVVYRYDANGNLSTIVDGWGRQTTFSINGISGRLESIIDPDGRVTSFSYDENDQLVAWINPLFNTTRFAYDACFRLKSITTPQAEVTRFKYIETSPRQRLVINARNYATTLTLDDDGNISRSEEPEGVVTDFGWDDRQRLLWRKNALGKTVTFSYSSMTDLSRRLSAIEWPIGTATYNYGDLDNARLSTFVDQNGNVTTLQWDELNGRADLYPGAVVNLVNADSRVYTYTYTGSGQLATITDPKSATYSWTYDSRFRRSTFSNPNNDRTTFTYDGYSRLLSRIDAESGITSFTWLDNNLLATSTDPNNETASLAYDANGRLTTITDPSNASTVLEYDGDGRIVRSTDPLNRLSQRKYDSVGNLTETVSPRGFSTTYSYDGANRLVESLDPEMARSTFLYDSVSNQIAVIDARNNRWTTTYDDNGRAVTAQDPLGRITTTQYDLASNPIKVINPLGQETVSTYTVLNSVKTVTDPMGFVSTMTYDECGRPLSTIDAENRVSTFVYDAAGRVVAEVDARGNTMTYEYDRVGRQTVIIDQVGNRATMTYDAGGRLATSIDPRGVVTTHLYDTVNRIKTLVAPVNNGIEGATERRIVQQYDAAQQLITLVMNSMVGVADQNITVNSYDADGNLETTRQGVGGSVYTYTYDKVERQTGVVGPLGTGTSYEFDVAGNRTAIQDAVGNRTTFGYDAANQMTTATTPLGYETVYLYDVAGRPQSVRNPRGYWSTIVYDANGRQHAEINALGDRTTYTYDKVGQVLSIATPIAGQVFQFTYDENGNVLTEQTAEGNVTTYTYYKNDLRETAKNPRSFVTTTLYDSAGMVTTIVDQVGSTVYSYDFAGRLSSSTNRNNDTTGFAYNNTWDQVAVAVDPRGFRVTSTYDANGNLVSTSQYLDGSSGSARYRTTTFQYDAAQRLTTTISNDPSSGLTGTTTAVEVRGYDANGRLNTVVDPIGLVTTFQFDADGRQTAIVPPRGYATSFEYGPTNKLVAEINPLGYRTTHVYDALDRCVTTIDAENNMTEQFFDQGGRLVATRNGVGASTTFTFDLDNRVVLLVDANNNATTYQYDGGGNRIVIDNKADGRQEITYSPLNAPLVINTFLSGFSIRRKTVTNTYDNAQRLTVQEQQDVYLGSLEKTTLSYDDNGNLASSVGPTGQIVFTYDGANQIVFQDQTLGSQSNSVWLTRNLAGSLISCRTIQNAPPTSEQTVQYTYDKSGRLITTTKDGQKTTYTYDPNGNVIKEEPPYNAVNNTGVYWESQYDIADRVTDRWRKFRSGGGAPAHYTYTYDKTGRQLNATGSLYDQLYDGAGRLISAQRQSGTTDWVQMSVSEWASLGVDAWGGLPVYSPDYDLSYTYDGMGNVLVESVDGVVTTSTYSVNRVVQRVVGGVTHTYEYDDLGRRTRYTDGSGGLTTLVWDSASRLSRIDLPSASVTFSYDSDNLLRSKQVAGETVNYIWVGDRLIAEADQDGIATKLNLGSPTGFGEFGSVVDLQTGIASSNEYDQSGTTRSIFVDEDMVNSLVTRPFGELIANNAKPSGSADPTMAFSAQYGAIREPLSGLIYLRQRWYDPVTKQFLSADPLGPMTGGPNQYLYAGGDPINQVDPQGLDFVRVRGGTAEWMVESAWGFNQVYFPLGTEQNGRINFNERFLGGSLPLSLVKEAAANAKQNGYDLSGVTYNQRTYMINGLLDKLRGGGEISYATGQSTVTEAFGEGFYLGTVTLGDTATFSQIDVLNSERNRAWAESGMQGTWVEFATAGAALIAREAAIAAITAGTASALSAASAGTTVARAGWYGSRVSAAANWGITAINSSAKIRNAVRAVNLAGTAYDVGSTAYDTYNGIQQIREGNAWGWLSIAAGGVSAIGAAASIRKLPRPMLDRLRRGMTGQGDLDVFRAKPGSWRPKVEFTYVKNLKEYGAYSRAKGIEIREGLEELIELAAVRHEFVHMLIDRALPIVAVLGYKALNTWEVAEEFLAHAFAVQSISKARKHARRYVDRKRIKKEAIGGLVAASILAALIYSRSSTGGTEGEDRAPNR